MTTYAQTSCTLSTITDVTAVYTYYYLASSVITSNMAPKDNINPPDEDPTHDPGERTVTVTYQGEDYVWRDIDPTLDIAGGQAVGQLYYIECVKFSDGSYDWGPLMTSSTYAAAKAAYNLSSQALAAATSASSAVALLGGHFVYKSSTSASQKTPPSANVIEVDDSDPTKWKHNVHIGSNGIRLRYNEIPLVDLSMGESTSGGSTTYDPHLMFYAPKISSTTHAPIDGDKAMELTTSGISFYQIGTNGVAASLTNGGLNIQKGTIQLGSQDSIIPTSTKQGFYVDNNGQLFIGNNSQYIRFYDTNNDTAPDTLEVHTNNFSIDAQGNVSVTGAITATSLTIGSGQNAYNGVDAINISGYSITIEIDTTHAGLTTNQVYLKPHLLHNGEDITSTITDKTQFIWYANGSSIGTQGASVDGGIVAAYDDVWKVIYQFAEGAVGGASPLQQTLEINPIAYITRINQYGITVHPETVAQGSHYTQIDGNGLYIKELVGSAINLNNDNTLASFTATGITMGLENASHFNITPTKLSGHLNTNEYFSIEDKYGVPTTYTYSSDGETRGFRIYYPIVAPIVTINDTPTTDFVYTDDWVVFDSIPTAGSIISITYSSSRSAPAFTNGIRSGQTGLFSFVAGSDNTASGLYSIAEGWETQSTSEASHAEGRLTIASGDGAHSEGFRTTASGSESHAEGFYTIASGSNSHAEGSGATASGVRSHAEGSDTTASGVNSHAEGDETTASEINSHAEGSNTTASGRNSHAQNDGTVADRPEQTAIGRYNTRNISDNAFVIGNGEDDSNRSNALTVDWDGGLSHGIQNVTSDITLTKSTGTASADTISWTAYKAGQTIFLTVSYVSSASFSNATNRDFIFTGKYAPIVGSNGFGYYQGNSVGGRIFESNGDILLRLRNTGSAFIPNGISVTFTYITEDMN